MRTIMIGKVKSVPVTSLMENIAVIWLDHVIVVRPDGLGLGNYKDDEESIGSIRHHISKLTTLVVEYDASLYESEFRGTYKQLPISPFDWKKLIKDKVVDTDKEILFEKLIDQTNSNKLTLVTYAKIFSDQLVYTEQDIRETFQCAFEKGINFNDISSCSELMEDFITKLKITKLSN